MSAWYRLRQWWRAARARPLTTEEWARVRAWLGEGRRLELFATMGEGDRRHALEIADALWAQGARAPDLRAGPLMEAALLHDVAKREVGLGVRSAAVLLNGIARDAVTRLAGDNGAAARGWRRPWQVWLRHPELGARLAARAGADPRAVALIRNHQTENAPLEGALAEWHAALKALDDRN